MYPTIKVSCPVCGKEQYVKIPATRDTLDPLWAWLHECEDYMQCNTVFGITAKITVQHTTGKVSKPLEEASAE